jgi:hypothetical protein
LQDPPKFTQIVIFGLKTNHLATLVLEMRKLELLFQPFILLPHVRRFDAVKCYSTAKRPAYQSHLKDSFFGPSANWTHEVTGLNGRLYALVKQ